MLHKFFTLRFSAGHFGRKKTHRNAQKSKNAQNAPFCTDACNTPVCYTPVSVHPDQMKNLGYVSPRACVAFGSGSRGAPPSTVPPPYDYSRNVVFKTVFFRFLTSACDRGSPLQSDKECLKMSLFSNNLVPSALADPDRPLNTPSRWTFRIIFIFLLLAGGGGGVRGARKGAGDGFD